MKWIGPQSPWLQTSPFSVYCFGSFCRNSKDGQGHSGAAAFSAAINNINLTISLHILQADWRKELPLKASDSSSAKSSEMISHLTEKAWEEGGGKGCECASQDKRQAMKIQGGAEGCKEAEDIQKKSQLPEKSEKMEFSAQNLHGHTQFPAADFPRPLYKSRQPLTHR